MLSTLQLFQTESSLQVGHLMVVAIFFFQLGSAGTRTYLTQGTWDVTKLLAYDTATKDM